MEESDKHTSLFYPGHGDKVKKFCIEDTCSHRAPAVARMIHGCHSLKGLDPRQVSSDSKGGLVGDVIKLFSWSLTLQMSTEKLFIVTINYVA